MRGMIFDIQRFSLHDGPGIRTTVFLKGCPLHCKWCCNPESMSRRPVLLYNPELCVGCGKCIDVCASGASSLQGMNHSLCVGCGKCVDVCYAEAKQIKGREVTPEAILKEVLRDRSFYERTGGGVTFSGGEPLLQIDFLEAALRLCREAGLHTAIETCGCVPWESFERAAPLLDTILFDIKSTDNEKHRLYTGAECCNILSNCAHLAQIARELIIRVPVIPEFNFDQAALERTVRFAEKIGVKEVDFLPYHRYAANKYSYLGQEYWNPGVECLSKDEVHACIRSIQTSIKLQIGG